MRADPQAMLPAGRFTIAADHAALAGHFPGRPIVPGVVVIDHAARLILRCMAGHVPAGLRQVKFLAPVLALEEIETRYAPAADGQAVFACLRGERAVVTGVLLLRDAAA